MNIKAMTTRELESLMKSINEEIEYRKSETTVNDYLDKYFYINEPTRFRMINITGTDEQLIYGVRVAKCREITLSEGRKRHTECDSAYDSELMSLSRCFESVILVDDLVKLKPFPKETFERIWKQIGEIDDDYNMAFESLRKKFWLREDELAENTIDELNEMNIIL